MAGVAALLLVLSAPGNALAHSGSLDSLGCHPNVAHGSYHCHTGRLAGRSYGSKPDAEDAYKEDEQEERAKARLREPPRPDGPTSTVGDR